MSSIMSRAVRHGYLMVNPCREVEWDDGGAKPKPTMIDSAQVELRASLIDPHYRSLVVLLAFSGLRRSEATGLRWGDIDFGRGVIHVRRTVAEISVAAAKRAALPDVTPGFVEGPTRNKHERTTVLLPRVAALLSPGAADEPVFGWSRAPPQSARPVLGTFSARPGTVGPDRLGRVATRGLRSTG